MRLVCVASMAAIACTPIVSTQRSATTWLREEERQQRIPGEFFEGTADLEGTALVMKIERTRRCRVERVAVLAERRWIDRRLDYGTSTATQLGVDFGIAGALGLLTMVFLIDAKDGCKYTDEATGEERSSPNICYGAATVTGVIGSGMVVKGFYDAIAVRNTDLGVREVRGDVSHGPTETCERSPYKGPVVVSFGTTTGWVTASASGIARIEMRGVASNDLAASPGVWVGRQPVAYTSAVAFPDEVVRALAAVPGTTVAREVEERALSRIATAVEVGDWPEVRRIVELIPAVGTRLSTDTRYRAAVRNVTIATTVALLARKSKPGDQLRLCAARWLVKQTLGDGEWDQLRAQLAESALELFALAEDAMDARLFSVCGNSIP